MTFRRTPTWRPFCLKMTFHTSNSLFTIRRIKWPRLEELYIARAIARKRRRREAARIPRRRILAVKHSTGARAAEALQAKLTDEKSHTEDRGANDL